MESNRPRGRSFVEEDCPPPLPLPSTLSSSNCEDNDDNDGGPVMYDPTLVFDDEDEDNNHDDNKDNCEDNSDSDFLTEEEEEDYYTRGRSRSRSVHANDDVPGAKPRKGLSEEELQAQVEQAAKNQLKESNKPVVARTGALKQREVQALQMGLEEATRKAKEEERLEELAEREAAEREKEERSVSISNSTGRGSLQLHAALGTDPPMRRVKILMLGDSSVGKTSLIHRLTDNTFKQSLVSTVGVDYKARKVQLWDTAGSEKFHKITQSYYRGVHGIMLVFDVSNRKSFKHVSYWLSNISKFASERVQVQLVGNKVDLRPESKKDGNTNKINKFMKIKGKTEKSAMTVEDDQDQFVETYEGNAVASKFQIKYTETSALNNTNIEESLHECVRQVIHHLDNPTLMSSLREKLQRRDSKVRANHADSKGRLSSVDKKTPGVPSETSTKNNSKDKDCVIS